MPTFLQHIDEAVTRFFMDTTWPGWLDGVMTMISKLGDAALCWLAVSAALFIMPRTRKAGMAALLALLLSLLLGELGLKNLVARPRPYDGMSGVTPLVPPLFSFSFPSGHTFYSFASVFAYHRYYPKKTAVFWLLAGLIGLSRVYLRVHYLTDVLAGAVFGVLMGFIACALTERLWPIVEKHRKQKERFSRGK